MRKRVFIRIGAALCFVTVLAIALTACGSSNDTTGSTGGGTEESGQVKTTPAPGTTYTVGIDIPFHPIFDYVQAEKDKYFAGKPYNVQFKVLDATTQVPAFGKGDLSVMTTPPSFIPRVEDSYGFQATEFFPLARWTTGPQILVPSDMKIPMESKATLEALKGKSMAVPPLNTRFGAEEAAILAVTGENIRDYFNLKETPSAAQELSLGRVEAAFIEAPTTFELLEGGKFKAVYSVHNAFEEAFGDPAVVNGGYIAKSEFLEDPENEDFVNTLVEATQDAWNRYNTEEAEVNKVASKISGVPAEQLKVVGEVLDLKNIPESERAITQQDVETWEQIFPLLEESGFIKKAPEDPSALFKVTE